MTSSNPSCIPLLGRWQGCVIAGYVGIVVGMGIGRCVVVVVVVVEMVEVVVVVMVVMCHIWSTDICM